MYKGFDLGAKTNETAFYVAEYNSRQRLQKIGFIDSVENIDALTGEYFVEISKMISKLEDDERSKK